MINDLGFMCCFCNNNIKSTDVDPCNINVIANYDKKINYKPNQDFFCHFACLKDRLHDYYQGQFLESTFSLREFDKGNK